MIVTLTMNPAVDKTVEIDKLVYGGLNRIKSIEYDAGGKGINVSKTISKLGGSSVALGFVGGRSGNIITEALSQFSVSCDFIHIAGETRTNTKIYENNGTLTELNESGPVVTAQNISDMIKKLIQYADKDTLFVLSGSIPRGVNTDIYANITRLVHTKGASVMLDADGDIFKKSIDTAPPDIIKPNKFELEQYANINQASENDIVNIAKDLVKRGIKTVAVSMGSDGAVIIKDNCIAKCPALSVKAHSTVGAGDAMVAALAYSWEHRLSFDDTVKLCMATSAGAITTTGTKPPEKELVNKLSEAVVVISKIQL